MPSYVKDEAAWTRAKELAGKGDYSSDSYWAVVTHIYQRITGSDNYQGKKQSQKKYGAPKHGRLTGEGKPMAASLEAPVLELGPGNPYHDQAGKFTSGSGAGAGKTVASEAMKASHRAKIENTAQAHKLAGAANDIARGKYKAQGNEKRAAYHEKKAREHFRKWRQLQEAEVPAPNKTSIPHSQRPDHARDMPGTWGENVREEPFQPSARFSLDVPLEIGDRSLVLRQAPEGAGRWVTIHGSPIFLKEGQDINQAFADHFAAKAKTVGDDADKSGDRKGHTQAAEHHQLAAEYYHKAGDSKAEDYHRQKGKEHAHLSRHPLANLKLAQEDSGSGHWITVNGAHIFIPEGKDQGEHVRKFFASHEGKASREAELASKTAYGHLKQFLGGKLEHFHHAAVEKYHKVAANLHEIAADAHGMIGNKEQEEHHRQRALEHVKESDFHHKEAAKSSPEGSQENPIQAKVVPEHQASAKPQAAPQKTPFAPQGKGKASADEHVAKHYQQLSPEEHMQKAQQHEQLAKHAHQAAKAEGRDKQGGDGMAAKSYAAAGNVHRNLAMAHRKAAGQKSSLLREGGDKPGIHPVQGEYQVQGDRDADAKKRGYKSAADEDSQWSELRQMGAANDQKQAQGQPPQPTASPSGKRAPTPQEQQVAAEWQKKNPVGQPGKNVPVQPGKNIAAQPASAQVQQHLAKAQQHRDLAKKLDRQADHDKPGQEGLNASMRDRHAKIANLYQKLAELEGGGTAKKVAEAEAGKQAAVAGMHKTVDEIIQHNAARHPGKVPDAALPVKKPNKKGAAAGKVVKHYSGGAAHLAKPVPLRRSRGGGMGSSRVGGGKGKKPFKAKFTKGGKREKGLIV